MNEELLLQSCLEMPEVQLLALIKMDFANLLEIQLEVVEDWIKNKRCECSKKVYVQNREIALKCEHMKKRKKEKTKEIERKINFKSNILSFRKLGEFQRVRQSFYTI